MYIVTVTLLKKGRHTGELTYFSKNAIELGDVVSVPIRSKKVYALVVEVRSLSDAKEEIKNATFNLRKIEGHKGPSVFGKNFFKVCRELARYYTLSESIFFDLIIPTHFIESYDALKKQKNVPEQKIITTKEEKLIFQAPLSDRMSWYKTFIRESFARKKSVFIALPTISDIAFFTQTLSKGIEMYTFTIHGEKSKKEQLDIYNKIVTETHPVLIIGTIPFSIIPRADIGAFVIEHESSPSYKMVKDPHVDLRLFLELFASSTKTKLILGDTILRIETLARYDNHELTDIGTPIFRLERHASEGIITTKINYEKNAGTYESIGPTIREVITQLKEKRQHLFIFTLRSGLSTITVCRDCGDTLSCTHCNAPLVLYTENAKRGRIFICTKCKRHTPSDAVCARCGSWNLIPLGIGIEYVVNEIKKDFPDTHVFRIDRETVKTPAQAEKIIAEFRKNPAAILVGTETALAYLTDPVDYVGVAAFDSLFNIPSFRINERIVHLVLTLEEKSTKAMIIQTRNPTEQILGLIKTGNLLSWYREELEDRRRFSYPPFSTALKIRFENPIDITVLRTALTTEFGEYNPDIFKSAHKTKNGKEVLVMILRIPKDRWSLPQLSLGGKLDPTIEAKLLGFRREALIEVDPENLF